MKPFELLTINKVLFEKMKDLAIDQEQWVAAKKMKKFIDTLSQRDRLQKEIDRNTATYRRMLKSGMVSPEEKKSKAISLEIANLIQSIQEIDQKIENDIIEKKAVLYAEIKDLRGGQKALKGYGRHSPKRSKFISRTG